MSRRMNTMPTNDKTKPKAKTRPIPPPPPPESPMASTMSSMMGWIKRDKNWKILLGIAIGFLAKLLFG